MIKSIPTLLLVLLTCVSDAPDRPAWSERPVNESGVRGTLLIHGGVPRPAMLVVGGAEGGVKGVRSISTHLADQGYNVLTLAYFGLPGMRTELVQVPLEDFFRALDWLHGQSFTGTCAVGILGCSKGAEASLLVAARREDLGAVVAYVPTQVVWECIDEAHGAVASSWTLEGVDIPFVPYQRLAPRSRGTAQAKAALKPWQGGTNDVNGNWGWDCLRDLHVASLAVAPAETVERASIPVERIRAPVLLFSGGQDLTWPSLTSANAIEARVRKANSKASCESVTYPNAGHSFMDGSSENGGTEEANREAQGDSRRKLETFLALHLPVK